MLIKFLAHELKTHIIVFDLHHDTIQFCSGNHLKRGNIIFESPLILYATGNHFQSVFQKDHAYFIKLSRELEGQNNHGHGNMNETDIGHNSLQGNMRLDLSAQTGIDRKINLENKTEDKTPDDASIIKKTETEKGNKPEEIKDIGVSGETKGQKKNQCNEGKSLDNSESYIEKRLKEIQKIKAKDRPKELQREYNTLMKKRNRASKDEIQK